jgi:hypothetical protein
VQDGRLRTSYPIYLYSIEPVKVTKAEIVETANSGRFVQYNGDASLRIPLISNEEFKTLIPAPNAESVRNAINKYEQTKQKTIFIDYVALVKEVAALNAESEAILSNFVNELMQQMKTLKVATNTEIAACKSAMEDEGVDVTGILG